MLRLMTRGLWAMVVAGCGGWDREEADPYDLEFDIPRSEAFPNLLSAYELYAEPASSLEPTAGSVLYELSSALYTDQAYKQRLVRLPEGASVAVVNGTELVYPEGTVMAKTFYYPDDMRDDASPRRIIETRLLVKTGGVWNVATYLWNEAQTDATLLLDGTTTDVSWIGVDGVARTTAYVVPHEGECVTCHQANGDATYIGPTLRNLNREVSRNGETPNQLDHLVDIGVIEVGDGASAPVVPDYEDLDLSLETRARAYLDANCAHCHQPGAWDGASRPDLDLRYETPLPSTGLQRKADDLVRQLENGEMPYLGVTLPDEDGAPLVVDYVRGL